MSESVLPREASFFLKLESEYGSEQAQVTRKVLAWAAKRGLCSKWGEGERYGSCRLQTDKRSGSHSIALAWTHGSIEIYFRALRDCKPFASSDLQNELLRRLNTNPGVNITDAAFNQQRTPVYLHALTSEKALEEFLATLDWVIGIIQQAGA